jgi:hypothetical protein
MIDAICTYLAELAIEQEGSDMEPWMATTLVSARIPPRIILNALDRLAAERVSITTHHTPHANHTFIARTME